jgi:hypothetical protein
MPHWLQSDAALPARWFTHAGQVNATSEPKATLREAQIATDADALLKEAYLRGLLCTAEGGASANHLVGAHKNRLGDHDPKHFGGLEIHHEKILGGLLDWKAGGTGALQHAVDKISGTPKCCN